MIPTSDFISFLVLAFLLVSLWFVFTKAKQEGWKALIPFYNLYTECKIAGREDLWKQLLIFLLIEIFGSSIAAWTITIGIASLLFKTGLGIFLIILGILFVLADIAAAILLLMKDIDLKKSLSKRFGKDESFAYGLVFLAPIFFGILAFDKTINFVE